MYFKYSDGSLIQLVKARYSRTDPQELTTYHVPLTDINGAIPLGLDWQTWTINGVIADPMSVRWRDIIWLSLDNVSWRACRVQATAFPTNQYQQSLYELTMLVSPILEGAAVRYPSYGYLFGNQGVAGISQAGNVNAYPTIHYLAPLFYAPLSNTLIDFTGAAVTFTRTASKVHGGVTYPINTPIFDRGLYLASDTAQDVATWTPPASTLRTVAMQLKSRYPSPWSIGGGGVNLLTANQSNAETDTTGMEAYGTLTRNTVNPIAGTADFKVVAVDTWAVLAANPYPSVTAGHWYAFQCLAKGASSGLVNIRVTWRNSGGGTISAAAGASATISATARLFSVSLQSPSGATSVYFQTYLVSGAVGDVMQVDNLMIEAIPIMQTVWHGVGMNILTIDTGNNYLIWQDNPDIISVPFPTAAYMAGTVTDIVVIDDVSRAVTVAVHAAGGAWASATGTLSYMAWPQLTLGNLEGSIANLIEYPYALSSAEYQALAFSSLSLGYWFSVGINVVQKLLYIGNRYAGEIVKGSDKRLLNANGGDISALLGGTDLAIGSAAGTIAQSQGLAARWYVELKRTDV